MGFDTDQHQVHFLGVWDTVASVFVPGSPTAMRLIFAAALT